MDVLIIYQFCSFGGVERAVLNRASTFLKFGENVHLSIGYLHDYGALASFQNYIRSRGLADRLTAFLIDENNWPDLDSFDLVLNIDTPQVFERTQSARNLFLECHTPYIENRQYLKSLPGNLWGLIVPSIAFKELIEGEFSNLPPIHVLPNPVSEEFFHIPFTENNRVFPAHPLAYLARLDPLKNFTETKRIFQLFKDDRDFMFAVVGTGTEEPLLVNDLIKTGLLDKTFLRNQVPFNSVPAFVQMIKDHHGVFISSSKGESFGLSAAEFISAGVPVMLSAIPPHLELVENDESFTYPLGKLEIARERILSLVHDWDNASQKMGKYAQKFRGESFVASWHSIVASRL